MSLITNPSKVIHNAAAQVAAFFSGPVWAFLLPFVHAIESQGGAILVGAAEAALAAGFAAGGTGEAKMKAALAFFAAEVTEKGLPFIESQARALIEAALQKAKAAVA